MQVGGIGGSGVGPRAPSRERAPRGEPFRLEGARSRRERAFELVALQLGVGGMDGAMPACADRTFDAAQIGARARDAGDLSLAAHRVRERLGIPGGDGLDGWTANRGDHVRRVGLLRRGPEGHSLLVQQMVDLLGEGGPEGEARRRSLARQLSALARVRGDLDPALVLAVAMRESGARVVSAESLRMHSFDVGGLDHLGAELVELVLPRGYGETWEPEAAGGLNHAGRARLAAWIPENEALVAYGAVLARRTDLFEGHVREIFGARAERLLSDLGTEARRVLVQLAFGAQNGAAPGSGGPFGIRTALLVLKREMDSGRARGLDDVLRLPELRAHTAMRRALVTAAEAVLLDPLFA